VTPAEQFEAQLPLIERVIRFVARRRHMSVEEAEEFASTVRLKLIENDYDVLRRHEGRSSLQTYLGVVVQRVALDFRISRWGKWRPSAEATRLGEVAVLFERLTIRDGHPFGEACALLRERHGVALSDHEFDALAAALPPRAPRRFVEYSDLDHAAASSPSPSSLVDAGDRSRTAARTWEALTACLGQLPAQDRLLLRLRFEEGMTVAAIGKALRLEPQPLYRRFAGLLRRLRTDLELAGVSGREVMELVGDGGVEWSVLPSSGPSESLRSVRPYEG
jgi:RNA polymerase sigma factor for flagellar operon FliA